MCIQRFIKIFHIVEDLWLFPFFCYALPGSVNIGIWLDLVSINLCMKNSGENYQYIPRISRVMGIFGCLILALALPRSRKSGI